MSDLPPVPRLLRSSIRVAIAVSVIAHLGLGGAVLVLADYRPFAEVAEEPMEVDLIPLEQAPPPPELKSPNDAGRETLDLKLTSENQEAAPSPAPANSASSAAAPPQQQKSEAPSPNASPAPRSAQAPAAAPSPLPPPPFGAEPDITVKYAVALGLPEGNPFGSPAEKAADIGGDAVGAMRQRVNSCAALPPSVAPSDSVKIVLRVILKPDGRLAQDPILVEASASAKGPALMQSAMKALAACQPYTMLPADKYQEWKVLDLAFSPRDFRG